MATKTRSDKPTVIKKYANRRLYDTGRSSYVTLDDLCTMVKEERDFVVYDAKTGEDLTRSVLTQIIVDQEGKGGQNLLPISFLRQLIGYYGDSIQSIVPNYLEHALDSFSKNQEKFREMFSVSAFEELSRQNMSVFENAMKMNPWASAFPNPLTGGKSTGSDADKVQDLKETIAELQKEIDRLSK
ncbi:polyhydroxyalkanoate synthesis repressor PhaR [Micavibrio aeruginosavorus]|uniref:Polyhydroxyalkanoate synthesis repressor PhaR n=2 Tax=Micavibrio aeruginosavorus TaxID=349221 RepID=G2KLR2_MICAA|nr:polyhydroxyalkanoate synthesis repressor PhaR [Micavibrio aeruginosavorus]AEP09291.1 polyhydroxyalkanoate synthesis repressor PhaR [Micavibrio aeruginosavorus ARL-13]AGH97744.1 PhbF [Micavibrio aeruginosavorus EPB]